MGAEWAGRPATVVTEGDHVRVFVDGALVREVALDRSRRYQRNGRPPGARPHRHIHKLTPVNRYGNITVSRWRVALGDEYIGRPAEVEMHDTT